MRREAGKNLDLKIRGAGFTTRFSLLLALPFCLTACSLLAPKSGDADPAWQARRAQLELIQQFTVQARVSSGLFGVKGNLHWRQRPDDFEMRFSGPLGANAVSISGNADEVAIRTAQDSFRTTDPETFLHDRLGWTFPVRQLRWWVLGAPAPGSEAQWELDTGGRVLTLEQDGWTLEFDEYQFVEQTAGTMELPRKFELANNQVTIKVVVDAWSDLAGAP